MSLVSRQNTAILTGITIIIIILVQRAVFIQEIEKLVEVYYGQVINKKMWTRLKPIFNLSIIIIVTRLHSLLSRITYMHHCIYRGLCPNDYPDVACRSNTSLTVHIPPLLFNLNSDPGELRPLDTTKYQRVLEKIEMV